MHFPSRRYWVIQENPYMFSLVFWVIEKIVKFLTFLPPPIYQVFRIDSNWAVCPLSSNLSRLVFCSLSLINLDFKFDLGNNVIFFRNLQSWALRQYKFYFLSNEDLKLHLNKIVHSNLREGSFPSFLWVVTSHLPWSLCSQGSMAEKAIFCKPFWLHVKCRMEMSLSVFNFFFCMGYDVLVKIYTGKKN